MKFRLLLLMFITSSFTYAHTLTVGITGDNPPFSSIIDKESHYYGFDMEIMDGICKRLKVHCRYVPMLFSDFFDSINNNQIDLAIDSIIITPEREQKFLFSQPYLTSRVRFVTNQSSSINSPDDIINKRIGVRQRNQFQELFTLLYKNKMKETVYPHMPELLLGLAKKEVDAIIINNISAQYWTANNNNQYKLIGSPIPLGKGFGIMAKLGKNDLINNVNIALQNMESDGTYLKIYSHYFGN